MTGRKPGRRSHEGAAWSNSRISDHVLRRPRIPISIFPVIVGFILTIPNTMMLKTLPRHHGIGNNPLTPIWAQMIAHGVPPLFFRRHLALILTTFLAITVLTTSHFGEGLRDALDPTLKGK